MYIFIYICTDGGPCEKGGEEDKEENGSAHQDRDSTAAQLLPVVAVAVVVVVVVVVDGGGVCRHASRTRLPGALPTRQLRSAPVERVACRPSVSLSVSVCVSVRLFVCVYACVSVCVCIHMYICIHICIYMCVWLLTCRRYECVREYVCGYPSPFLCLRMFVSGSKSLPCLCANTHSLALVFALCRYLSLRL